MSKPEYPNPISSILHQLADKDGLKRRREDCLAVDPGDEGLRSRTGICPQCTKTVIKEKRHSDSYFCTSCNEAFCEDELIKE